MSGPNLCVYYIRDKSEHSRSRGHLLLPLGAQLDVLSGGQGGFCSLKLLLTVSLPSQLIYGPNLRQTAPPHHLQHSSSVHTLSRSLYLSLSRPLSPRPGVKTPAARSSGDKSDLPGRVIVKHPPGRLRPPHPFNSSAGTASRERRRALRALQAAA